MPRDPLLTLAIALPLTKGTLLATLALLHGHALGGALPAVVPEVGAGALLMVLHAVTRPSSASRGVATVLGAVLFAATWIAAGAWAFTGTVVPYRLIAALAASPAILTTAVQSEDLRVSFVVGILGWLPLLAVAGLLAAPLRRLEGAAPLTRRGALLLGLAGLVAIAIGERRAALPGQTPRRLTLIAAAVLGDQILPVPADAPTDLATLRDLGPPTSARAPAASPVRNVLVLVLESIRFESGSPFVADFPEAIRFDRVYAHQPRSVKTLEALLFGIYPSPQRETAAWAIDQYDVQAIGTLPALLRPHGFETSYLGAMDANFENYQRTLEVAGVDHIERVTGAERLTWGVSARTLFARAAEVLEAGRTAGRRQLVVAWTTECHRPYDSVSTGIVPGSDRDRYRLCQRTLADALRGLLARLTEDGALADTLVLAFGDHGQLFPEDHPGDPAYAQSVHERSVHVPLLAFAPAGTTGLASGSADERLFQLVDVPATIAAAVGARVPERWVGRNLLDPAEPSRELVVVGSLLDANVLGLVERSGRKVTQASDGSLRAYDLARDPAEENGVTIDGTVAARDAARLRAYATLAAGEWSRHLLADKARQLWFAGVSVGDFGRTVCLQSAVAADEGALRLTPSAVKRCAKRAGRHRELVRQLPPDVLDGASAVRLDVRLRLDEEPAPGTRPKLRARVGGFRSTRAEHLEPRVGDWQDVQITVPVERTGDQGRPERGSTVPLGIAPVDQAIRFSVAAIRVEPVR